MGSFRSNNNESSPQFYMEIVAKFQQILIIIQAINLLLKNKDKRSKDPLNRATIIKRPQQLIS